MSAEATGWAIRHSPYTGVAFTIHIMVADSVNDQHEQEFWMAFGKLARKARTSRKSVTETIARMVEDGFVEVLEDHRSDGAGKPSRYRFLFSNAPVVFETRLTGGVTRGGTPLPREVTGGVTRGGTNPREPKENLRTAPPSVSSPVSSKKPQPRRPVFDALVEAWGVQPKTKAETGRIVAAMKQIKDAEPDHPDDGIAREILRRARRYRETWPNAECTPTALAANWSRFSLDNFRRLESVRG